MKKAIKVKPVISGHSLAGISGTAPFLYGNYFWMGRFYVVNMWVENFRYLLKTNVINATDELDAIQVGDKILITDSRIPAEFLNKRLCFTGCGNAPTKEEYKILYEASLGQSENCYCNDQYDYVSFECKKRTYRTKNIASYAAGFCKCCGREMFLRYYNDTTIELTEQEFTVLWENTVR